MYVCDLQLSPDFADVAVVVAVVVIQYYRLAAVWQQHDLTCRTSAINFGHASNAAGQVRLHEANEGVGENSVGKKVIKNAN